MSSYCDVAPGHPLHGPYHDREYGFPLRSDDALFERLILEINQAGLSWLTILQKRENFSAAYHNFDVERLARYGKRDIARLMNDASIIRNRLKIEAAITNAGIILDLCAEQGSFSAWLDHHHPMKNDAWVTLFKQTFRFTGGEITKEFLMSTGYLPGAHQEICPVYKKIAKQKPAWMLTTKAKGDVR